MVKCIERCITLSMTSPSNEQMHRRYLAATRGCFTRLLLNMPIESLQDKEIKERHLDNAAFCFNLRKYYEHIRSSVSFDVSFTEQKLGPTDPVFCLAGSKKKRANATWHGHVMAYSGSDQETLHNITSNVL